MKTKLYYVYILTHKNHTVLYTGMTKNLRRRLLQHKNGPHTSFTHRYNIHKLVYFEWTCEVFEALLREKKIKAGSRQKKIELIESFNPEWKDLAETFCLNRKNENTLTKE